MSFVSILKRIGKTALEIERLAAPIAEAIAPEFAFPIAIGLDELFGNIQTNILMVEVTKPGDGLGNIKSAAVISDFDQSLEDLQALAATSNMTVVYDKEELQIAIDCQVAAYNAMSLVKTSMKLVPKP